MTPNFSCSGDNGQLHIFVDKIVISRKGVNAFLHHGFKGDKTILVSALTAVQFREASIWHRGVIEFAVPGSHDRGVKAAAGHDHWKDDHAIVFGRGANDDFIQAKRLLDDLMQKKNQPTGSSAADEIAKLAALLEKGHISEAEFQVGKQRLLESM